MLDSALRAFDDGLEQLGEAIQGRDADSVARTAHRMVGIALDIDLAPIAAAARKMETDAAATSNWTEIERSVESIETAVEAFRVGVAAIQ